MTAIQKLGLIATAITIVLLMGFYYSKNEVVPTNQEPQTKVKIIPTVEPKMKYGIEIDSFVSYEHVIQPNQFLANILHDYQVSYTKVEQLVKQSEGIFNVKRIAAGKKYTMICEKDSAKKASFFVYEPNATDYIVFDIRDSISIYTGKKEVTTEIKTASGVIKSSLYQSLDDANVSPVLAIELSNVFAWTIDFYRIQKNDWFKVIYEEKFVEGKSIGIGKVIAANFNHYNKDFFACHYTQDGASDYFDEEANSLRRAFLKSPLKFGRLTSGFTMRRFHPVQKRNKPHLGTDYAAPTGTPIMATGDGVVIASSYSKYNGNFVKIKHNGTYTTQYLHMSKRGVKVGQHVNQGDIIGFVGSTGLATGPHVCYRFWKNGRQTNHLKEDFPPSKPVRSENLEDFNKTLKKYQQKLSLIKQESFS